MLPEKASERILAGSRASVRKPVNVIVDIIYTLLRFSTRLKTLFRTPHPHYSSRWRISWVVLTRYVDNSYPQITSNGKCRNSPQLVLESRRRRPAFSERTTNRRGINK